MQAAGCSDRAMAGWDVTVLVAAHDDVRPLQILGVKSVDLELALDGPERSPAALSVAADLYVAEERVRHVVGKALKRETPEITIWGRHRPFELNRRVASVHHQLSSAAAFSKPKPWLRPRFQPTPSNQWRRLVGHGATPE